MNKLSRNVTLVAFALSTVALGATTAAARAPMYPWATACPRRHAFERGRAPAEYWPNPGTLHDCAKSAGVRPWQLLADVPSERRLYPHCLWCDAVVPLRAQHNRISARSRIRES